MNLRLSVDPASLASTLTCERVRRWLERKRCSYRVIELPALLLEKERKELTRLGVRFCYIEGPQWE